MKKSFLVSLMLLLVIGFFALDVHQILTLEGIKASLDKFEAWRSADPILVGSAFFVFYVLVTALSLPGAAVMTLAAGALFGLWYGVLLVSFASSVGASLAFLISRYVFRDAVQKRFGERLKMINEGVHKDGAFYLFSLRLVPIFPFFLINLLMGLTPIGVGTFYLVSQVGMLAGTFVYINAGTQLAQLDSMAGILSPTLLLSFALLGLFPLVAKKWLEVLTKRRVYAKWTRPKQFDRNLVVIGAGAGGLVSAYIAATVKAKVTLIEAHKMGGDCLNYGCVPSKALIKSAKIAHQMQHANEYGLNSVSPSFSFNQIMHRIQNVIQAIEPHDSVERYSALGVDVLEGYAQILDPWTVAVKLKNGETQKLTTRSIILATGAHPFIPDLPGLEASGYVTSDTLWEQFSKRSEVPKHLVVLGGGPIGCELAQCFARLGSSVTQVEMAPRLMLREDEEISALAQSILQHEGVRVLTNHKALRCEVGQAKKHLVVECEGVEQSIEFEELICAVGRVPRLEGYGLEELGIETRGKLATNAYLETLYPNIYAAGDLVGHYQFTHTAAHQAWYAAVNALFGQFKRFKVDYRVIPWTTFLDPEVARVGINEQEAKEKGIEYELTRYDIGDLDRAITESSAQGLIKVLTEPGKDRILGVTIVAEHASDLLAEFVLAMKQGLGLNKILGTIHTYPTWSEANKYAAGEWKRAHAPEKILTWVEKYHNWRRGGSQ